MRNRITQIVVIAVLATLGAKAEEVVSIEGVLFAHASAIGGETTGIVVQHNDGTTTDLEITNPAMLQLAETLDHRRVFASGWLKIVHGVQIPERRVLQTTSLTAANRDVVCKSSTSDYRLEISLEMKKSRVLKGPAWLTTLACTTAPMNPVQYFCYEPNVADAGYQVIFNDTSGVRPHAELYEVFFWGRKLLDRLDCLN